MRRAAVTAALALAAVAAVPALAQAPQTLTIYSSLPLQGDARPQSEDVVRAIRMALDDAGGRVGVFTIKHVSLDDATAEAGSWDPGQVSENARRAVGDRSTIGYIGEFNSGASAISIPILNEAGIPQISPSNTYVGLTRGPQGAERGEPDKYYPTGTRTYARVVPADHLQARAVARYLQELKVRRAYLVDDGEVYGDGVCDLLAPLLAGRGVAASGRTRYTTSSGLRGARRIARTVRRKRAAMVYCGITQNRAGLLFKTVAAGARTAKLFGIDGVAESAFTEAIGSRAAARTYVTDPTLPPSAYPESARDFFAKFQERFGRAPEPYAIYGYEAMSLLLDAMRRAGAKAADREEVVRRLFATASRESVLGPYSIDRNGDTTLPFYGGYRVAKRQLVFDRLLNSAR
jgi:branched-chain amino acid transport system substrate-binding protein